MHAFTCVGILPGYARGAARCAAAFVPAWPRSWPLCARGQFVCPRPPGSLSACRTKSNRTKMHAYRTNRNVATALLGATLLLLHLGSAHGSEEGEEGCPPDEFYTGYGCSYDCFFAEAVTNGSIPVVYENCTHEVYENGCARLRYYPSCHCCMDTIGPPPVNGYFYCCRAQARSASFVNVDFLYMSPYMAGIMMAAPNDSGGYSSQSWETFTSTQCQETDGTACLSNPFLCGHMNGGGECSAPPPSPPPCGESTTWNSTTGQCEITCDEGSNGRRMTDQDFRLPALA